MAGCDFVKFWQYVAVFVPKWHEIALCEAVFTTSAGNLR
jgi:hypothetical protein